MKRKIYLVGLIATLALLTAFTFASDDIPDPPNYGMWLLREGKMYELPAFNCTHVGGYRGVKPEVKKMSTSLKDGDRIFYFFPATPPNLFTTPLDDNLTKMGGDPWKGGAYPVNLFLPSKNGDNNILRPVKIRPAKVINGVVVHELMFMFSGGDVLHSGVLISDYLSPASAPIYLFYYHKELTPELKEQLMKRFGKK